MMRPPDNRSEIAAKIIQCLTELLPHADADDFKEEIILDSVVLLHFIMALEETFQISISNHELDIKFFSELNLLTDFIEEKLYEIN